MKLVRVFTMVAVLGTATIAAADKEAPRDEVSQADADKFLGFFGKFVDAVVGNKDNCTKMAGSINGVIDGNAEILRKANEARAANKKLPKAIEEKMMARVKEMMPAMQKCGSDKDVQAAIARMDKKK